MLVISLSLPWDRCLFNMMPEESLKLLQYSSLPYQPEKESLLQVAC